MSGGKVIGCLQRFAKAFDVRSNACYLEVGVFQGLSLTSTAVANRKLPCYGIDNFSAYDEDSVNHKIVKKRIKSNHLSNAFTINKDFEDALASIPLHIKSRKIGMFFVDGPHDYRSHLMCLLMAYPHLAHDCVIVIDDSNYAHVRQATADFLYVHKDMALVCEAYTPAHPDNLAPHQKHLAVQGWWNGVNILVRDSMGRVPRRKPATGNRDLFFMSHDVFRHELGRVAHPVLKCARDAVSSDPARARKALSGLRSLVRANRAKHQVLYAHQNTHSENLRPFVLNRPKS